jgi:hypothetical protein
MPSICKETTIPDTLSMIGSALLAILNVAMYQTQNLTQFCATYEVPLQKSFLCLYIESKCSVITPKNTTISTCFFLGSFSKA